MKRQRVEWIAASLSAVALGLLGCSGGDADMTPIRGEVIYNGEPLKEGTVIYTPQMPRNGQQASGGIQEDGTFEMTTRQRGDGVKHGAYNISIYAMEPHPGEPQSREEVEAAGGKIERGFLIPEKYADPRTSGLTDTVDGDHAGFKKIELSD